MCISPKHKFLGFITIFSWPYWACQRASTVIRKEDDRRSIPGRCLHLTSYRVSLGVYFWGDALGRAVEMLRKQVEGGILSSERRVAAVC